MFSAVTATIRARFSGSQNLCSFDADEEATLTSKELSAEDLGRTKEDSCAEIETGVSTAKAKTATAKRNIPQDEDEVIEITRRHTVQNTFREWETVFFAGPAPIICFVFTS